jgi:CBS domain-containing protein
MQTVSSVMTAVPVTLPEGEKLIAAARAMRDNAVGAVMVVRDGQLRGMVTDRDIVIRGLADGRDPQELSVGDVCSPGPVTVRPGDDIAVATQLMRDRAIRRLPVVEDGYPVGLVTIGDLAVGQEECPALADICAALPNR